MSKAAVPLAIIAAVVAVTMYTGYRGGRRNTTETAAAPIGLPGAPVTSAEGLANRIRDMESRLAASADDVGAAVRLVEALLRQTRITSDVQLAARAEQAMTRALRNAPDHYEANRMRAELHLSQHRFREAIAAAERTRAQRPSDPINYGVLGDAYLELGEYDDAFAAFDRMMTLRPSAAAYAREIQDNLSGALEAMKLAAQATPPGDLEARAWHHSQIGELYLQLGRPARAKQEFINASHAFPGHPFAVIGYARAIEAEGDAGGALTLLRDLAAKTPSPDLFVRIGGC